MELSTETKVLGGILIVTLLVIVGGAFVSSRGDGEGDLTEPVAESNRLVRDDSPTLGPADAALTIVEFGDFQCPACASLHPVLQAVKEQNKDNSVRFVYRQFPLVQIHEFAQKAAEASLAAKAQGKFWEYHDLLFENSTKLTRDDLVAYAEQLELDINQFTEELDNDTYKSAVGQGIADGTAVGVRGTPTLFLNGSQYTGQYSVQALQAAIDAVVQDGAGEGQEHELDDLETQEEE